ncbi:MAG: hypothetical protein WD049_05805 [Candidatus Paceibacterota bacterium]
MPQIAPEDLGSVTQWHFAIGGLETAGEVLEMASAIRIQRLRSFPTQAELSARLNNPFVAGIIGHYGDGLIGHQLIIDAKGFQDFEYICDAVRAILAGLRVRTRSELFSPAVCNRPWDRLDDGGQPPCIACRFEPHVYSLELHEPTQITAVDLDWVKYNLSKVLELNNQTRFNIALDALCSYLHTERDRMKAAQLWVGIEAIFEVQYEISYRLPLLAALILEPRGERCKTLRQHVKKLYSQRSKAIHGQEFKDPATHVREVRELLARLLETIIEDGHMPTKQEFDDLVLMPDDRDRSRSGPAKPE